jgi:glycosyltransferase involved in cell wall biosynthesis
MGPALEAGRETGVTIRVLEVLATLKRAGAERMAVSLARGLDPARFETAVVSLFDAFPDGFEPKLEASGIPIWHLGKRPGLDLRMIPRLRRVFNDFRPDIIHTHSYVLRYTLPASFRLPQSAMVHTVHNLAARESDFTGRLIHRLAFGRRVATVAVGEIVARSYREMYGAEPSAVIRNGIDTTAFQQPELRQRWRSSHGFSESDFLIVSAGRLDPQKNPLGLISAFSSAFAAQPHAHLLLAGDGSLRDACRKHILELGLAGRVHLLGTQTAIMETLAASDLFALASHWEGTPLAVIEAMAAGLPVVATAAGGVPELVVDGLTALLAPVGDMDAFANQLARLGHDARLREMMGQAGRLRSAEFGVGPMVSAYASLFERLAAQSPEARP